MKKWLIICLSLAITLIYGCEHCLEVDTTPPAVPVGLTSITGDRCVYLYWYPNQEKDLAGYCIYRNDVPTGYYVEIGMSTDANFIDYGVINGKTYYYCISAYDRNGNESGLSEVVYDTPRPEGSGVVLWDYRTYPNDAGYDFSDMKVQRYNNPSTDIYFEYDWDYAIHYMNVANNNTKIQDFGYTDNLDDVDYAPEQGWSSLGWVELILGHSYIVRTWDNHYAKFRVTWLGEGSVKFDWAYQVDQGNRELVIRKSGGLPQDRMLLKANLKVRTTF